MASDTQPPSDCVDAAIDTLRATGRSDWASEVSWVRLAENVQREDHRERFTFLLSPKGGAPAHLTIAADLRALWEKTSAISSALPALVARPLFFDALSQGEMLVREFVAGKTLHELLESQQLSPEKAEYHARATLQLLEATRETSSIAAAQAEAAAVMCALESLPVLRPIDRAFIREILAPPVFEQISHSKPYTRWTNGDFTSRNLVLGPDGNVRLIDYEFAQRTHFPDDTWRWDNLVVTRHAPKLTQPDQYPAWLEMFFWCRQLVLSHRTTNSAKATIDTSHAVQKILTLLETTGLQSAPKGLFLNHYAFAGPLKHEIACRSASEASLADKIARMQSSRSWRCTAWLRAIRRFFS